MKKNIGQLTGEIFALLEGQEKEDSIKVLNSVSTLLGIMVSNTPIIPNKSLSTGNVGGTLSNSGSNNAKEYFDEKQPKNKGEEFAVAAKFRIDNNLGDSHTREDLKAIIKSQAKKTFDDKNFTRDIQNTISQAKLFMSGDHKGEYILSSTGEKYVDALPDRSAAALVRKPGRVKKSAKKSTKKATKK